MADYYLIHCEIERGGFSTERIFEIELPNHDKLVGTAYVDHLRDEMKRPLDDDTPGYGHKIKGYVRCLKLRQTSTDEVVVEVPSADVIHVPANSLIEVDA